jgi:hypothetical protein
MFEPPTDPAEATRRIREIRIDPSHAWVLGLAVACDGTVSGPGLASAPEWTECTCPAFCPRDHENE